MNRGEKVVLELTPLEAESLAYAVGNSLEEADSLFPDSRPREAAHRAHGKLRHALADRRMRKAARTAL